MANEANHSENAAMYQAEASASFKRASDTFRELALLDSEEERYQRISTEISNANTQKDFKDLARWGLDLAENTPSAKKLRKQLVGNCSIKYVLSHLQANPEWQAHFDTDNLSNAERIVKSS